MSEALPYLIPRLSISRLNGLVYRAADQNDPCVLCYLEDAVTPLWHETQDLGTVRAERETTQHKEPHGFQDGKTTQLYPTFLGTGATSLHLKI